MLQKAELPYQVQLVCGTVDAEKLRRQTASLPGVQCLEFNEPGIHRARQFILEHCPTDYALMLDDDMEFFRRQSATDWHLRKCESVDIWEMILEMLSCLDEGYPLVGISARQGNNRQENTRVFNTRMNNAYAMHCNTLRKHDVRWDRLPLMEDFDVTLQLLRLGYENAVLYEYAWNQNGGSNAAGGCSTYRTNAMQAQCAEGLKALHPNFVTVVTKKAKAAWKGMEERKDVRMQWKKALASAPGGNRRWMS